MQKRNRHEEQIYKDLYNRALTYARVQNYPSLAEDFAQEYCLAIFRGRKASIKHLFIDFLRKYFVDFHKQKENGVMKYNERAWPVEFNENRLVEKPGQRFFISAEDAERLYKYYKTKPEKQKRRINEIDVIFWTMLGYDRQEIADLYEVVSSRVSQILTELKKEMGRF